MHAGGIHPLILHIPKRSCGVDAQSVLEISEDPWHGTEDISNKTS
jgi:hypothetical protein